jgi:methionine aminotransferase
VKGPPSSAATPALPSRLPGVGTTIFTVVNELAERYGALNLAQGFPDFEPPLRLRELVRQHVYGGHNQYAPMAGVVALREAICAKLRRCYGREASPTAEVTVTCGGTEAIACAIQAATGSGDEVVLFDPAYDSYEPVATLAGARTRRVPLARPAFRPDWERFAAVLSARTRLVVLNSPHNPSGGRWTAEDFDELARRLRPTQVVVISDEVYEHMVYDGRRHLSVNAHAELRERAFVISSFGKTYHATGWKIGYCVAPASLTAELRKVHQFLTFAIASPLQYALADFMTEHPEHEAELAAFYEERRDRLCALLRGSRLTLRPAEATYFQLVDYSALSDSPDVEFARELIEQHGVAAIPLSPFSAEPPPGERLLRLCFAKADATLVEAARRLVAI